MAKEKVPGEVLLRGVRLSFPALFEPQSQTDKETGKVRETFKANFLIPKKGDPHGNIAAIKAAAAEAKRKKWGENEAKWPKLKPEKVCLRDGDQESWDGYEGNWYLSSNAPVDRPPSIVTNRRDSNKRWIEAKPGREGAPYAGCYVNAVVRIWAQDNEHGKRLNASLESVQFAADGEHFGATAVDPNDAFGDEFAGEEGAFGDDEDEEENLV